MFQSAVYKTFYSSEALDFEAFKTRNHCPALIKTFQTSVWLSTGGMLLGSKSDMDDVALAVEKVRKFSDKLRKA